MVILHEILVVIVIIHHIHVHTVQHDTCDNILLTRRITLAFILIVLQQYIHTTICKQYSIQLLI